MRTLGAILAVVLIPSGIVVPAAVEAGDLVCHGRVGHRRVAGIRVPNGAICVLDGTQVEGNVKVDRGGTLLTAGATIRGNIDADRAQRIQLVETRVLGNIDLRRILEQIVIGDCSGPNSFERAAIIEGNLQLFGNYASASVCGATIRGNMLASQNRNALTINFNRIRGNLRCDKNTVQPQAYGNRVGGNREGECAG